MPENRRIKVVQVVGLYHPAPMYGTALVARKIAEQAHKRGFDSYVLTTDLQSYHPYVKLGTIRDTLNGVKIVRANTLAFPKQYPYFPLNAYQALSGILNNSNGIIHAHTHLELNPFFAAFYKLMNKKYKFILQPHFHPFPGGNFGGYLLRQMHEKTVTKFLDKCSDAVVVMSQIEKDIMRKSGVEEDRISIIPHGIDAIQAQDGEKLAFLRNFHINDKDIKLICVTRVSVDILKFFCSLLKILGPGFTAVLVGGIIGNNQNEIKRIIPKCLMPKIVVTGFIPRDELSTAYCIGDYFVKPTKYEAFGIAFLEAMAAGLPIMSYRVGALPEIIQDGVNGFLFEKDDVDRIAKKIRELQKSEKLYKEISNRNREKAKQYKWDTILEKYIEIYEELAKDVEMSK